MAGKPAPTPVGGVNDIGSVADVVDVRHHAGRRQRARIGHDGEPWHRKAFDGLASRRPHPALPLLAAGEPLCDEVAAVAQGPKRQGFFRESEIRSIWANLQTIGQAQTEWSGASRRGRGGP
ncbi:hypothetical protein GCM10009730_59650 [Streptomyces albidochromogenes]